MPRVLNYYHDEIPPDARNVMRPGLFGNPYIPGVHGTREQCLEMYRKYFRERLSNEAFRRAAIELKGKDLVCCCAPLPCHADIIMEELERL